MAKFHCRILVFYFIISEVGKMINFVNELKQTQSPNLCLTPTYTHSALRDVSLSHANLKTDGLKRT